jgi:hypothetical protein
VVVAVEIQDAQTAKEAFGSDAVADSVGDANAANTAGTVGSNFRLYCHVDNVRNGLVKSPKLGTKTLELLGFIPQSRLGCGGDEQKYSYVALR